MFEKHYKKLAENKLGINIDEMKTASENVCKLSIEEMFKNLNIEFDEIIYFKIKGAFDNDIKEKKEKTNKIAGVAIFYKLKDAIKIAIIINESLLGDSPNDEKWIYAHNALMHELGHADDFIKKINFSTKPPQIDLVKAEAYADVFVIEKLIETDSAFSEIALSMYVQNVLSKAKKDVLFKQILNQINLKFSAKQLHKMSKINEKTMIKLILET